MLSVRDALRQLVRDVRGQKLRTFLTLLGVVWGTVAVTLLLAFGTGLHRQMITATAGLGDRIAIAWPGLTSMPHEGLGRGRRIRIDEEAIAAVRSRVGGLRAISSEYSETLKLHAGTRTLAVDVSGVSPEFGEMRNLTPVAGGRFLNPLDEARRRRVLFLGDRLARDLLGDGEAVGRIVLVQGSPFQVVGVLREKEQDSSYSGPDAGKAWMPGATFRALTGARFVDNFVYRARDVGATAATGDRIREALGRRLRFSPDDREALSVWDTTEQFRFFDTFFLAFNLFLGVVGSLTLVVGGIGVSNIMHVAIEERTREIGIKMALGAREGYVLRQVLLETLLVTGIGGLLGLAVSLGICAVFPRFGLQEHVGTPEVSPLVALVTVALLGAIGLVAGWSPAREAARLDPVVAMKL